MDDNDFLGPADKKKKKTPARIPTRPRPTDLTAVKNNLSDIKKRTTENLDANIRDQCDDTILFFNWSAFDLEVFFIVYLVLPPIIVGGGMAGDDGMRDFFYKSVLGWGLKI